MVWCPKCEIGGQFVNSIEEQPNYWVCPECGTRYELPEDFYSQYIPLRFEVPTSRKGEIPPSIAEEKKWKTLSLLWLIVLISGFVCILRIYVTSPMTFIFAVIVLAWGFLANLLIDRYVISNSSLNGTLLRQISDNLYSGSILLLLGLLVLGGAISRVIKQGTRDAGDIFAGGVALLLVGGGIFMIWRAGGWLEKRR